jgi:hypothetical protein
MESLRVEYVSPIARRPLQPGDCPGLRLINALESNHNDGCTVHRYRLATSHEKFAASILDHFSDLRSSVFCECGWVLHDILGNDVAHGARLGVKGRNGRSIVIKLSSRPCGLEISFA